MTFKKYAVTGIMLLGLFAGSFAPLYAQSQSYTVKSGDTFYLISKKYGISMESLMKANNATAGTILYPGNVLTMPSGTGGTIVHTVVPGDTFWKLSQKYNVNMAELMKINNANENTILYIGQKLQIPQTSAQPAPAPQTPPVPGAAKPYITYKNHTVKSGDTLWNIAAQYGVPMSEVLAANNMTASTWLNIGDVVKIPVHNVPVKQTPGDKYGEYLDWWTEAQYVIPAQSVFEVVDFTTGRSFYAKRTTGSNHADVETLTLSDTNKMKDIWGGAFSWQRRPVIIKIDGRKIAASAASIPHAGNDSVAGGVWTTWRSGDYPAGYNLDWVKNNGIDGVFDIHFANSTRHSDGLVDAEHQKNVRIAAGLK